jgi:putative Holliday junction resolvase
MQDEPDIPRTGRLIGLDAGERRIGVAVSDPDQRLAVPLRTITRDRSGSELRELSEIARQEEVAGLVIGMPVSLSGEEREQARRTREFAQEVALRLNLPVAFWDERLSSQEAERILASSGRQGRRGQSRRQQGRPSTGSGRAADRGATDLVAATIILQAYLDSRRGMRFEV